MQTKFSDIKKLKLIACDLDGTLLLNGAQRLQPNTCKLIHRLTKAGVVFMAASGRQYESLKRLFAPIMPEIAYLCENGCISYFEEEMVHQTTMEKELGKEIIEDILATDGCEALVSGRNVSYLQPKRMSYHNHIRDDVRNNVKTVQSLLRIPEPYMKISVYREGGLTEEDIRYWNKEYGKRVHVVTSGNEWLDMMPLGVDKGSGMLPLLKLLNVAPEECMAIGDNYNDREMLEMVGMPVAVDTAKPEILEMCGDHTDTVEHYLERILSDIL
ncbi:MAG: HAD family hydrolase [Eubacteriales bacterium]|nr:HAD family hydrolase [Eubacteriales bacterium]